MPKEAKKIEVLLPLSGRIVFIKDDAKIKTKGGILLTEEAKIEVFTGRVIAISQDVKNNPDFKHLRELDKIITNFYGALPVELDPGNKHYILPITSVLGVWRDKEDLEEDD